MFVGRKYEIAKAMSFSEVTVHFDEGEEELLLSLYDDQPQTSWWARKSIATCIKGNIITGKGDNIIAPKENLTRVEVAHLLRKLLTKASII